MKIVIPTLALAVLCCANAVAQYRTPSGEGFFLIEAPDARSGAMGNAGVASTPDANAVHWNPANSHLQPTV